MIIIVILLSVNALVSIVDDSISFHMLAYIDLRYQGCVRSIFTAVEQAIFDEHTPQDIGV
ncbi:hypothetical protein [Paenibacillus alvei]|uniref:hypothetical protein n=1 Tax=Paenibacillus alvei TaxID=44250 RepID=UPI0003F75B62|nr:hypothetical protein [Paenibacillus alvei]